MKAGLKKFPARLQALKNNWEHEHDAWKNVDAIVIANGEKDEDMIYKKSTALQIWLFGAELLNTIFVLTDSTFYVLTTSDIASALKAASENSSIPVVVLTIQDDNSENFASLISGIRASKSGTNVGASPRDKALGKIGDSWKERFSASGFTSENIAPQIGTLFLIKDAEEIKFVTAASAISCSVLKNHLLGDIETIIDESKTVTHSAIAEKAEDIFADPTKLNSKLTAEIVELSLIHI
eukprot:TRINITY_DN6344_c0_g1_i2.p1 TRINITY_DN6344_c0_g1~~TRINITY_DN6344_c0_g1_i2.p1  ORF type:complete len:238 (-),score=55.06 TRINITY_DN6344_c0_g1_i2:29-742(-)